MLISSEGTGEYILMFLCSLLLVGGQYHISEADGVCLEQRERNLGPEKDVLKHFEDQRVSLFVTIDSGDHGVYS